VAIGIPRTVGTIWTTSPVGIVDGVLGIRRAIAAVGVTRRVSVIGIGAQLAAIVPLLVIQPRCVRRIGIGGGLIAVRTAVAAELIRDAIRQERVTGAIRIGGRVRIECVGGEVAEIFSMDRERDEQEETREEEFHTAPPGGAFTLVFVCAGRQVRVPDSPINTQADVDAGARASLTAGQGRA